MDWVLAAPTCSRPAPSCATPLARPISPRHWPAQAHDAALTTASAEVKWLNGWSTAATFEGEFSNVTRSYAGKGVVRYSW
jgi:hypothetical protein